MTDPIAAAERIAAHLARSVMSNELRADAAVLLEMARGNALSAASGDLETLARDLRQIECIGPTVRNFWSDQQLADFRGAGIEESWLRVARHVQHLQREAWIAGRDAAALRAENEEEPVPGAAPDQFIASVRAGDLDTAERWVLAAVSSTKRCIAKGIRALEPPARETGA